MRDWFSVVMVLKITEHGPTVIGRPKVVLNYQANRLASELTERHPNDLVLVAPVDGSAEVALIDRVEAHDGMGGYS